MKPWTVNGPTVYDSHENYGGADGCMPDSDPIGPFNSSDAALTDARSGLEDI